MLGYVEYHYVKIKIPLLFVLSKMVAVKGISCADIGCGYLPTARVLREVCARVYAYDINDGCLHVYRKLSSSENVVVSSKNVEELDVIGDGRLGLVIALNVLEHLRNPYRTVKAISRSMDRNGVLIVSVPWTTAVCRRAICEDETHRFVTSVDGWVKLIEAQGFRYLPKVSRHIERAVLKRDMEVVAKSPRSYLEVSRKYSLPAAVSGFLGVIQSIVHGKPLSLPCSRIPVFRKKG